jgi:hypothetical protein
MKNEIAGLKSRVGSFAWATATDRHSREGGNPFCYKIHS